MSGVGRDGTPAETGTVYIAGAGPAGCLAALYLARQGLPVVLCEAEPSLPVDLRASTFHPPSLEMLDALGLAKSMVDMGLVVDRYQYRDRRTGEVAEFDMSLIAEDTSFPFRLQLEQYEMTRLAVAALEEEPTAQVRFGARVTGFEQDDAGVTVQLDTAEGPVERRAAFLLGCDGASSAVRKAAGIGYGGFTYDEKFLVVSTDFAFEKVFDNLSYVNYVADPDEWCVVLRTDKLWRVLFPTHPETADDEAWLLADEHVQDRMKHLYDPGEDYRIGHRTLYNVHQRVSETYVSGRVALAGDACHINNPLGGMGMNGGLHDAWFLAEKLTRVLKGGEDHEALLAHYDRQRRALAVKFVQEHTIANKRLMESTDPDVQAKRQATLMATAAEPEKARAFMRERAMIDVLRESLAAA